MNHTTTDARIADALRRKFRAPSDAALEGVLRRALDERGESEAERRAEPGGAAGSFWPAAAILATAAAITLVANLGSPGEMREEVDEAPGSRLAAATPEWNVDACVGPLTTADPERELVRVRRPNLESIYAEATLWTSDRSWNVCGSKDNLADSLLASYGQELEVKSEAANMLQGPFASEQWPTGTILTGFPEDATAVLIAERDSTHACCLHVELPDESDLRMFTWAVGDLVLTEITPLDEPRLLDYFAVAP